MAHDDEELGRTATAPEGTPATVPDVGVDRGPRVAGSSLGRYVIESELGAGGMGVVYAAFDPGLERRVALKVLRDGLPAAAEQRLLQEARAMARLTHPNVVTVFEVGTVGGRDYVAMELIEGEPLVDWLRASKRSESQIVDAFLAAGRGLAAAHAAGIVHRDFKPHNVLRSASGRIAVTDFGLARDVADRPAPARASRNTPTALSGLTEPGALLGTPAYMAPEQWHEGEVTPATDQFAFCVALWEALIGERPFRGTTIELLSEQVAKGPAALDQSRLPRRLRALVVRGLDPDPAKRWGSMDELLARLQPRRRWPWIAATAAVAATAVVAIAVARADSRELACEAPALDPDVVWTPAHDTQIRGGSPRAADLLAGTVARWRTVRAEACAQPDAIRRRRLDCLDRVLARVDAFRRVHLLDPQTSTYGLYVQLYDPGVCELAEPPRLPDRYSDAAVVGLALRSGAHVGADGIASARAQAAGDPCATAYFAIVDSNTGKPDAAEEARSAAQLCGDEQAYAATVMNVTASEMSVFLTPGLVAAMPDTERLIARAAHPVIARQFARFKAAVAAKANQLDDAIAAIAEATDPHAEPDFQLVAFTLRATLLFTRMAPGDLAQLRREAAELRGKLVAVNPARAHERVPAVDAIACWAQWYEGDVTAAHACMQELARSLLAPEWPAARTTGVVVDPQGTPVAGATVTLGSATLQGDAAGAGIALTDDRLPFTQVRSAVTDARGRFVFAAAPTDAVVVAHHGRLRSLPVVRTDTVRLELHDTHVIRGRVRFAGERRGRYRVAAGYRDRADYRVIAPVRPDGTFELAGVVAGTLELSVLHASGPERTGIRRAVVVIGDRAIEDVEIAAPSQRELFVIVRGTSSARVDGAYVYASSGAVDVPTVAELERMQRQPENYFDIAQAPLRPPPAEVAALMRHGDRLAVLHAPSVAGTVCALGIQLDRSDPDFFDRLSRRSGELEMRCKPLAADATSIVVEVPPMKRLDD